MIDKIPTLTAGAAIVVIYLLMLGRAQSAPAVERVPILLGYFTRLAVTAALLLATTIVLGLDLFLTSLSFLLAYTLAFALGLPRLVEIKAEQ